MLSTMFNILGSVLYSKGSSIRITGEAKKSVFFSVVTKNVSGATVFARFIPITNVASICSAFFLLITLFFIMLPSFHYKIPFLDIVTVTFFIRQLFE